MNASDLAVWEDTYWREHAQTMGDWALHPGTGKVFYKDTLVSVLSPMEEDLLVLLWKRYPLPIGGFAIAKIQTVRYDNPKVYVHRLRQKLGPDTILASHRRGYIWNAGAVH